MKLKLILPCVFLLEAFSFKLFADEQIKEQMQAKMLMNNVYDSFVRIIPFVYSTNNIKTKNLSKDDKDLLINSLTDLSKVFKNAKHSEIFQGPGFRPSLDTINSHIEETIFSIDSDSLFFAQKRLNVLGALCVSCHSQLPESVSKNAFGNDIKKEVRDRFDSDFSYGNYLFMVRRFDDAKMYYEKTIQNNIGKVDDLSLQEVESSLKKILSIDTKIKFDYSKVKKNLDLWKADSKISKRNQKMISRWEADLKRWKTFSLQEIKSLPAFIKKHLEKMNLKNENFFQGGEDVTLLISSGVLLNYLVENSDSKLAPQILYWISIAENRMGKNYFFSLSDIYLKDCVKKYPRSLYANKCYKEYADSIEEGYTGSSGTNIPSEEKNELVKLKSLLKH
jgi:tetratricopeptide (TPR) repeat protein